MSITLCKTELFFSSIHLIFIEKRASYIRAIFNFRLVSERFTTRLRQFSAPLHGKLGRKVKAR